MEGDQWEVETLAAYYCFVNLGWSPSQYDDLPFREKLLVTEFVLHSIEQNKRLQEWARR